MQSLLSMAQMIENQGELRTALEKNSEQRQRIKQLETQQASDFEEPNSDLNAKLLDLQTHVCLLQRKAVLSKLDTTVSGFFVCCVFIWRNQVFIKFIFLH